MDTFADHALASPVRFERRSRRALGRAELACVVAVLILPVPLLAASGLSLPLPETIARLAAALVPWAEESEPAAFPIGESGEIVRTRAEASQTAAPILADSAPAAATQVVAAPDGEKKRLKADGAGKDTGSGSSGGSSSGGSSGSGSGGTSTGTSDPVGGLVGQVGGATEPVVGTVGGVVEDPVGTVSGAVEDPVGTVGGLVGALGQTAGGLLGTGK